MIETINVFIPAAGIGERMRPITVHIPKPLLPVAGKPVMEIIIEKVSLLSARHIGINLYYRADVIKEWIKSSAFHEKILLFPETPILGTGGALKNAEKFLSENTFLVHNADILSDIDLGSLIRFHESSRNLATLAVHDFPKFNTVAVDSEGYLLGVGNSIIQTPIKKHLAFTGIAVYDPEFLKLLPEGISSVVDTWLNAAKSGYRIGTFDVSGCRWNDIGTPVSYAKAVFEGLRSEGETVYVHPSASGCQNVEMDGYVVIEEKCSINTAFLKNCILLPGCRPDENTSHENCIIGPDFKIQLKENEILSASGRSFLIGTGGSERKYYRIWEGEKSKVLARFGPDDEDFHRHIEYTGFFRKYNIPVPALLGADWEKREAYFEDLGDLSLYSWLKCSRPAEQIEALYRKVIDIAAAIHTEATLHVSECTLLKERIFDYDHFRWETRYFIENFVRRIRNISVKDDSLLNSEFHRLALKADSPPKTVIHRDLQSHNIMVTRGATPRLIDYQGARIGPSAYDIASLLWDPYHRLEGSLRERLLNYYIVRMKEKLGTDFKEEAFRNILVPCRLQRHMQALGAYSFLSDVKGKKYFLKHVEEGVRLLNEDIYIMKQEYPELHELIRGL